MSLYMIFCLYKVKMLSLQQQEEILAEGVHRFIPLFAAKRKNHTMKEML